MALSSPPLIPSSHQYPWHVTFVQLLVREVHLMWHGRATLMFFFCKSASREVMLDTRVCILLSFLCVCPLLLVFVNA